MATSFKPVPITHVEHGKLRVSLTHLLRNCKKNVSELGNRFRQILGLRRFARRHGVDFRASVAGQVLAVHGRSGRGQNFAGFHMFLFRCSLCSRVFCVQAEVGLRSFQLWLKPETFTEEGVKDGIIKGVWMNWVFHRFYRFTRDIGNTGHHFEFHLAERLEENALLPAVRRSSTR